MSGRPFLYQRREDRIHVQIAEHVNGRLPYARKVAEALLKQGERIAVELSCHPRYAFRAAKPKRK